MRVAFSQNYEKLTLEINKKQESIDRLSTMISSGERLQRAADDPVTWAQAGNLRQGIREIGSLLNNINFASGWNKATETALSGLSDIVAQAKKIGVQSLSGLDSQTQQALTTELNGYIKSAVSLADSQYGDNYLFSGQKVTTAPFSITSEDPNNGVMAVSNYQGDTADLDVRVGKGTTETANINGQAAFIPDGTPATNLLKQLIDLKEAVRTGNTAGIQQQLAALDTSTQNLNGLIALTGTRQASLERKQDLLSSLKVSNQNQLTDATATNNAEAIAQLQQTQTVYEAALRVTANLSKLSLTQFI